MNGRLETMFCRTTRSLVSPRPECASRPDGATWVASLLILTLAVMGAGGAQPPNEPVHDIVRDMVIEPAAPAAEIGKSLAVLIGETRGERGWL